MGVFLLADVGDFALGVGLPWGDLLLAGDFGDPLTGEATGVAGLPWGDLVADGLLDLGLPDLPLGDLLCAGVLGEGLLLLGPTAFPDLGLLGERPAFGDFLGLIPLSGLSSLIGDFLAVATDFLFNKGLNESPLAPGFLGVAPFRTGVDGGSVFKKCSGLSLGPNDTLAFFDRDSSVSVDFLFFPVLRGELDEAKKPTRCCRLIVSCFYTYYINFSKP